MLTNKETNYDDILMTQCSEVFAHYDRCDICGHDHLHDWPRLDADTFRLAMYEHDIAGA